jgi:hypothetical protein
MLWNCLASTVPTKKNPKRIYLQSKRKASSIIADMLSICITVAKKELSNTPKRKRIKHPPKYKAASRPSKFLRISGKRS